MAKSVKGAAFAQAQAVLDEWYDTKDNYRSFRTYALQKAEELGVTFETICNWRRGKTYPALEHRENAFMTNKPEKTLPQEETASTEDPLKEECQALAEQCSAFIDKLMTLESTDKRSVALGKTNLQQGFMWMIRSIEKPTTF
jgi:hypothetical protein